MVKVKQRRGSGSFSISSQATIHESVVFGPNCSEVAIGHGVRIGRDVYIDVKHLTIGDYVTIHHGTVLHGERVSIGHNCWIGHYCILDGHGGSLTIGNNVGVGAQSQLWSHMKFGDVLAGCRWNQMKALTLEDDVWLVGHCIVTPITAKRRSMLMVGSTATRDMEENHVYAGSPARDRTDVFGPQFADPDPVAITRGFEALVGEYALQGADTGFIQVWEEEWPQSPPEGRTLFSPLRRVYFPRYTSEETDFMRFLLYDRAKFTPLGSSHSPSSISS